MERIKGELESSKRDRTRLQKHVTELEADIETLSLELDAMRNDRGRDKEVQSKVQNELDQLRALLEAKTSEETQRSEVERRKEEELTTLRAQVNMIQNEMAGARKAALEAQNKLKVDLDTSVQEHKSLQTSYESLLERERSASANLKNVQAALAETEKTKRSLDSELQSLRSRQFDTDTQLAEAARTKEVLIFASFHYFIILHSLSLLEFRTSTGYCSDKVPRLRRCCHTA
jgi:myosin heavy chain 9/10/11/14